jgi:uncharacterized damage-inducible protein DinB
MVLRDMLLTEFDHEMAVTRRLLACAPDAGGTWKPHERCRSFVELGAHLVEILAWSAPILDGKSFDLDTRNELAAPAAESMVSVRAAFADAARLARARVDRTDGELGAVWTLRRGGAEVFTLPRAAAFRTFVLGHVVHHRGQLSVYLRLNGIAVPPIYGPTGDTPSVRL